MLNSRTNQVSKELIIWLALGQNEWSVTKLANQSEQVSVRLIRQNE